MKYAQVIVSNVLILARIVFNVRIRCHWTRQLMNVIIAVQQMKRKLIVVSVHRFGTVGI
mgnify:FL=1